MMTLVLDTKRTDVSNPLKDPILLKLMFLFEEREPTDTQESR